MNELLNNGSVRTTDEVIKRVSLIDVVKIVLKINNKSAANILNKLEKDHPETTAICGNFKFPGIFFFTQCLSK